MKKSVVCIVSLALAACGAPGDERGRPDPRPPAAERGLFEANATVLEARGDKAMLCLGVILDSLPPQCGDIPIANWSWEDVEGEERAAGTTWGRWHVVGYFDGRTFELAQAPQPPKEDASDDEPIGTACPEPEGGWAPIDPTRTSLQDREAAIRAARSAPDFSGLWVDYYGSWDPDSAEDSDQVILNAAFTGNLDEHEAQMRAHWGGPLCLTLHARTYDELRRIQDELGDAAEEHGLQMLWSSTDEVDNLVEMGVIAITPEQQSALDERYGKGTVIVEAALRPLDRK